MRLGPALGILRLAFRQVELPVGHRLPKQLAGTRQQSPSHGPTLRAERPGEVQRRCGPDLRHRHKLAAAVDGRRCRPPYKLPHFAISKAETPNRQLMFWRKVRRTGLRGAHEKEVCGSSAHTAPREIAKLHCCIARDEISHAAATLQSNDRTLINRLSALAGMR
jgi:hypothetical protein